MTSTQRLPILRRDGSGFVPGVDDFANEAYVALTTEAGHEVSVLATPQHLQEFAIGHAMSEGWWSGEGSLPSVEVKQHEDGYALRMSGASSWGPLRESRLIQPSCGGCGDAMASPPPGDRFSGQTPLDPVQLQSILRDMKTQQAMFEITGGVHAATLVSFDGHRMLREDIGRHTAVDKVIGAWLTTQDERHPAALLLSGRCGWDLMAKAVRTGIQQVACVGAMSGQAAQLAREHGILVMGFAAGENPQFVGPWPSAATKS